MTAASPEVMMRRLISLDYVLEIAASTGCPPMPTGWPPSGRSGSNGGSLYSGRSALAGFARWSGRMREEISGSTNARLAPPSWSR